MIPLAIIVSSGRQSSTTPIVEDERLPFLQAITSWPRRNDAPLPPEPEQSTEPNDAYNIVFDSEYVEVSAAVAKNLGNGGRNLWVPEAYWFSKDGIDQTHWAYQGPLEAPYYGEARLVSYFDKGYNKGFKAPVLVLAQGDASDVHNVPSLTVDNDGVVWVVQEREHNTPLMRKRITYLPGFHQSQPASIATQYAYASLLKAPNGDYYIWSRYGSDEEKAAFCRSIGGFDNWQTQTLVTDGTADILQNHYENTPRNCYVNGKYYLLSSLRDTSGRWWKNRLLVTEDFQTYTNYEDTFSHNISVDGTMDNVDLDNCVFFSAGVNTQGCIPVACVTRDNKFFSIQRDGTGAYQLVYYNAGWQTREIVLSSLYNYPYGDFVQEHSMFILLAYAEDDLRIVAWDVNRKARIHRSSDVGVTWNDMGLIWPETEDAEVGRTVLPHNIMDIPARRNFAIFCSFQLDGSSTQHGYRAKRAAFDELQA